MQQFWDEIDVDIQMSDSHQKYKKNFTEFYKKVLYVLTKKMMVVAIILKFIL